MWTEPILHVDMDSFFVEVERLDDPGLRGIPVAVGGTGPRGVIASASYEARRFGVHSAQPTANALELCPQLRVIPPSHGKYGEVSIRVFEVFRDFTPLVEGMSLDEAYLDVAGLRRHFASPVDVARAIRSEVRARIGLPSSVGVAATKLVAKLASQAAKPDGVRHVPVSEQVEFLHALPAKALPGVGPATGAALERLGIESVADLAATPERALESSVGPTMAHQLLELANGIDARVVQPDQKAKSVSVEETYDRDLVGWELLASAVSDHAIRLAHRLRRAGLMGRTVTLKVRYSDFETITRSRTLRDPTSSARELTAVGRALLDELAPKRPVRLLGLGASQLESAESPRQLGFGSDDWVKVEDAVFEVRERYGEGAIRPGRGLDTGG
ncbi:MAG TPA: DNA polymerase IV [Acidimicrobiia bacterium]